ncbi:DUF4279 domain-containing protein [Phormidium nigroviride]
MVQTNSDNGEDERKMSNQKESEIYAYFQLIGMEFDPDEVTAKVGIKPTKIHRIGDLITSRGTRRYEENAWCVYSQLEEKSIHLEDYVKSVLEQLQPGWLPLVELCKHYYVEIACVIYYSGSVPSIHFDKYIVEMAHQLNAEIDVDLYVLREDTSEE